MKPLLLAIAILYALVAWLVLRPAPEPPAKPVWSVGERQHVEKRLKWHGINGAIRDEKGWYFINGKGERCRL